VRRMWWREARIRSGPASQDLTSRCQIRLSRALACSSASAEGRGAAAARERGAEEGHGVDQGGGRLGWGRGELEPLAGDGVE
jgi:hypothetical protein